MLMQRGRAAYRAAHFSWFVRKTGEDGNGFEDRTKHRLRNASLSAQDSTGL
jgi:hypothetical protein